MSYPGSEDAEGSNLKGNLSDLDDRRQLDSPWNQREDNVTATGTIDRCAGTSWLHVPVMSGPTVLFVCLFALRPKSTAMVIARPSVHLTTLFLGRLEQAVNQ